MVSSQTTQEYLIRVLFNEIWNQKKIEKIPEFFSKNVVIHAGSIVWKGIETFSGAVKHWLDAFPDLKHEIDQILFSENYAIARWHGWGTHEGIFMGMLPTKKKIEYSGITIFKVEGDICTEVWLNSDMHNIFSTLKTFSDKSYTPEDFCEDFKGPAAKIYTWLMKARSVPSCKQKAINALREQFSTVPIDGEPAFKFAPEILEKVSVQEHFAPGREGKIRCLVFLPEGYQTHSYPMLIYLHGGGWSIGNSEGVAFLSRKLAYLAKTIVVAVDYRLAPENPYPCGLNDSIDAYFWARKEGKSLFNANNEKIAVGGDSAGGNLAPAIVIRTRNEKKRIPDACLMICPLTDFLFEKYPSCLKYGYNGFVYDFAFLSFVRALYSKYEQWTDPEVSPLYDHLKGFCPTFVLTAGFDPLYDENFAFVKKLKEAGGTVEHFVESQMPHAYYYFLGLTKEEDLAYQAMSKFLIKYL